MVAPSTPTRAAEGHEGLQGSERSARVRETCCDGGSGGSSSGDGAAGNTSNGSSNGKHEHKDEQQERRQEQRSRTCDVDCGGLEVVRLEEQRAPGCSRRGGKGTRGREARL